ncbi:tyrosine-type recombinase/integrase [Natranaeroarchaeum aerophilus]|uniref:Site-specific integrase n=1 Tax=Natranaeroarchaeum aerophilus TaxID=2917711 RepID=A0AAE3FU69_9EURY|nr:site-specific integrase [Natranaeroarchaeum aerophilus]MCL9815281.1 site-specific integrase [Natranaeroarchaeum aerophilus]
MIRRQHRKNTPHEYTEVPRSGNLDPIVPDKALDMYMRHSCGELAKATQVSQLSRLSFFREFCDKHGIENMNNLTGRDLHDYRIWRREDGDLNKVSEKTQMDTLRVFIRFCEKIDAVRPGLSEKVQSPSLNDDENVRESMVSHDQAISIVEYLEKYQYGSLDHVVWELLASTGVRTGTLHALDVGDYRPEAEHAHLKICHRPGETPIKNGTSGERRIYLPSTSEVIDDYLEDQRPDVQDEYGRDPLLATSHGRISKSTIRKYAYKWTRPCALSGECPHGKTIPECEAAARANKASMCPSSKSPHPVRRGYLTFELESGVSEAILGERVDVNRFTLRKHYDNRSERGKMAQRKELFKDAHRKGSGDPV